MRASKGKENWVVGRSRSQQTLNVNGVSNYSGGSVGTRAVSLCVCATRRPGGRPDSSGKELRTLVWVAGHRTRGHSCTNACHTHNTTARQQRRVVSPRRVAEGASWHPPSHNYIAVLGVLAAIARGQRLAAPCTTHAPMPCHAPVLSPSLSCLLAVWYALANAPGGSLAGGRRYIAAHVSVHKGMRNADRNNLPPSHLLAVRPPWGAAELLLSDTCLSIQRPIILQFSPDIRSHGFLRVHWHQGAGPAHHRPTIR
jgi:hypothetical protein